MTHEIEKPFKTKLTNDQLRDLAYSGIRLIDIDPKNGTSSIMEGLSTSEYSMAMTFRSLHKIEAADLKAILLAMAETQIKSKS